MPLPVRGRGGRGLVADVDARVQSDRHQRARGVGLDDAQPQGLRHVAGILDLQHVGPARRADAQRIGFPTHVGRGGAGLELRDIAQRVMDGLAHAVAQGAAQSAGQSRQGRQLDLFPPAGTGGVDFQDLGQFSAGFERGRLPRNDDKLHPPIGDRPLPTQRLAQGPRPTAVLLGRDLDVVNALLFRQGQLQRNRLPRCRAHPARWTTIAAAGRRATGPGSARGCRRPRAAGAERPRSACVSPGEKTIEGCEMRTRSESPGARRTSRRFSRLSSCRLRNSLEMSAKGTSICGPRMPGNGPDGNFDLRPVRLAGFVELHDELGIGRGGDDDIDAVIGPRRALADHQAAVLQPHRARLVGLDPQRPRLGNGPAADGDRAFPEFFGSATPGDANHHRVVGVGEGRQEQQEEKTAAA